MNVPALAFAPRRSQRGTTLLESLIAFVLLATGTLAVASLQSQMRWHADVARQRSEAVRLGQQELERLRAFSVIDAAPAVHAYASIADADSVADRVFGDAVNTAYRIAQRIDAAGIAGAKGASVTVAWTDRTGAAQRVVLDSVVAGQDPVYSASLALGAGNGGARSAFARSPLIPIGALSVGGQRSVWKPQPNGTVVYVFDDASRGIVARCSGVAATTPARDLAAADLAACDNGTWALVTGVVRFSGAEPPIAADAHDASPDLSVTLALAGSGYPAPADCSAEAMKTVRIVAAEGLRIEAIPLGAAPASGGVATWADTGDRFVAYRCIVTPRADGRWSGRVALAPIGWSIGTNATDRRVCRYIDDPGGASIDANIGHPAENVEGSGSLAAQNFLVVRGNQSCPAAPDAGAVASAIGTVQHQP